MLQAVTLAAASGYRWFRHVFGQHEVAAAVRDGSSAGSPHYNTQARGALIGIGQVHHCGHLARAIMEGLALEMRDNLEHLAAHNLRTSTIRADGGSRRRSGMIGLSPDFHPQGTRHVESSRNSRSTPSLRVPHGPSSQVGLLRVLRRWILVNVPDRLQAAAVDRPVSDRDAATHAVEGKNLKVHISADLTLHYECSGRGPITLIFIPGWTMSTAVFARQLEHFAASDRFRAISYDPRGQGRSSKPEGGHTYQQHGRDLAALIDRLQLDNIVLIGWSSGVNDEMAYVNQFGSDRLHALVLIDGPPRATGADNTKEWVYYRHDDSDHARRDPTMLVLEDRATLSRMFAEWMLEAATPQNMAWVDEISRQTPDWIAALTNETGAYVDYEADLIALAGRLPTLIVVREDQRALATGWRDAHAPSAEVAAMGKHLMFWERSAEFNAVLDGFLKRVLLPP